MPQFGFGANGMGASPPNTGSVPGLPGLAAEAAGLGAPNAGALGAQVPGGRTPEVGQQDIDTLLQSLFGQPMAGMAGQPPPAGAPAMGPGTAGQIPPPGYSPSPVLPPDVASPLIGITPPGEDFPQAFKAQTGRYPTMRDYSERIFVIDFTKRVGRYPTRFEMQMQLQPGPRPNDGVEPEFTEVPLV